MIKKVGKYASMSDNEHFICGVCGTKFPRVDENGIRVAEKVHLKRAAYLKMGNEPVVLLPKMCYRCDGVIKRKIVDIFETVA